MCLSSHRIKHDTATEPIRSLSFDYCLIFILASGYGGGVNGYFLFEKRGWGSPGPWYFLLFHLRRGWVSDKIGIFEKSPICSIKKVPSPPPPPPASCLIFSYSEPS